MHQGGVQTFDGSFDEITAVINRDDFNALGQTLFQLLKFRPDALNGRKRVFPKPHYHNAAGDLTFPIQLDHSTPDFRADLDIRYILDPNGCPGLIDAHGYGIDILHPTKVSSRSNHILRFSQFN